MSFFDKLTNQTNNLSKEMDKLDKELAKQNKKEQKAKAEAKYQSLITQFENNNAYKSGAYYFDLIDNRMLIGKSLFHRNYQIINYVDILSCEINQHNHSNINTTTKKKHGIARAVTGGVLFGEAGAIVGSITGKNKSTSSSEEFIDHLGLVITLKDGTNFEIPFITSSTKINSFTARNNYGQLQKIKGLIDAGINQAQTAMNNRSSNTVTDSLNQIKKLKELLDIGAITEKEFQAKKKKLLNLE